MQAGVLASDEESSEVALPSSLDEAPSAVLDESSVGLAESPDVPEST